jgi:hypothetical protein
MEKHEIIDSYQEIYYNREKLMEEGMEEMEFIPYKSAPPEWYGNEDDDDTFNDDEDDNDGLD